MTRRQRAQERASIYIGLLAVAVLWSSPIEAEQPESSRPAEFIVFGADRTGSYREMTSLALEVGERFVKKARPGDEIYFRWISGNSYQVDQLFAHLRLPSPNLPTANNQFDRKARYQRMLAGQRLRKITLDRKRAVLARIRSQCPSATRRTDIYGFITAAAEQFAQAPPQSRRIMVIATDLDDNRAYEIEPSLTGVDVLVYPIKNHPNPAVMKTRKQHWVDYLTRCGAQSVEFFTPSMIDIRPSAGQCVDN